MHDFRNIIETIADAWPLCDYDHSAHLPAHLAHIEKWFGDSLFRKRYAAFKHTVARVLKPDSIVEIGVGFGVSAHAFLSARPNAKYIGYDSWCMDERAAIASPQVLSKFPNIEINTIETSYLSALPKCDLCHVDGGHDYNFAFYDVSLALRAAKWVLVDDCHDSQVAAATLQALYCWRAGDRQWAYFEDTFGGDILIYTGK